MKRLAALAFLWFPTIALASENTVYTDGTGAMVSFNLPVLEKVDEEVVGFTTFRIAVVRDEKFLLLADLTGKKTDDGKFFQGRIIIPAELVDSAEILLLGSPPNSSRGIKKTLKVGSFRKVVRKKCWTDQE